MANQVGGINRLAVYTKSGGDIDSHLITFTGITNIAPSGTIKGGDYALVVSDLNQDEDYTSFVNDYTTATAPTVVEQPVIDGVVEKETAKPGDGTELLAIYAQNSLGGKRKYTVLNCYASAVDGAIAPNAFVVNEITLTGLKTDAAVSISALDTNIDPDSITSYTSGDLAFAIGEIGVQTHLTNA